MTLEQAITKLLSLGIISKIGEEYFITSRATKVLNEVEMSSMIKVKEVPKISHLYPEAIQNVPLKKKVQAVLDYCKVPLVIDKNGSTYVVRSEDGVTRKAFLEIMQDTSIKPDILLQSITDYYQFMDYPKGFRRYVCEGDIKAVYKWYEAGNNFAQNEIPDNVRWE